MQNTNSEAFIRLKPLENSNVAKILQDQLNWSRNFNLKKQAQEDAIKVREAKIKATNDAEILKLANVKIDPKGYFPTLIVKEGDYARKKKLELIKVLQDPNATKEEEGVARLKIKQINDNLQTVVNQQSLLTTAVTSALEDDANYNPAIPSDINKKKFVNNVLNPKYTRDPERNLWLMTDKDGSVSEYTNDQFSAFSTALAKYSGIPDLDEFAGSIKITVPERDGNQDINDPSNKKAFEFALNSTKASVKANDVVLRTYASTLVNEKGEQIYKNGQDFSEGDKDVVAERFFLDKIEGRLPFKYNPLDIQKKKASIYSSYRSGRTKQEKTPDNDLKIIVTGIRKKDNSYLQSIISPEGQVGTSGNVTMAEYTKDDNGDDVVSLIWKDKKGKSTNVKINLNDPAFDMKLASYIEPKLSVPSLRKKLNEGSTEGAYYTPSEVQSGGKINDLKIKSFVDKFIKGDENAEGKDKEPFGELNQTPAKVRMDKLTNGRVKVEDNSGVFSGFSYVFPNGVKIKSTPENEHEIRKELTKLLSGTKSKQETTDDSKLSEAERLKI